MKIRGLVRFSQQIPVSEATGISKPPKFIKGFIQLNFKVLKVDYNADDFAMNFKSLLFEMDRIKIPRILNKLHK